MSAADPDQDLVPSAIVPPPTDPAPTDPPEPNPYEEAAQAQAKTAADATNPYQDAANEIGVSKQAMLEASVTAAQTRDPDHHAKSLQLADQLGLPVDLVEPQYDRYAKALQSAQANYPATVKNNPRLAAWLGDADNATVAQDDIKVLRIMDDAARSMHDPGDPYGILPPNFQFAPNGAIVERDGKDIVGTFPTLESLAQELTKREVAWQKYDQEAKGYQDQLESSFGPAANVMSAISAGQIGTRMFLKRVVRPLGGDEDPWTQKMGETLREDQDQLDALGMAGQRISPGFGGDIERGVGGVISDLPLMLVGGVPAKAARALLAARAGMRMLPTIARSKYLTSAFEAFAANLPLSVKYGVNAGADNGLAYGIVDTGINTLGGAVFGRTGIERAVTDGSRGEVAHAGFLGAARHVLAEGGMEATEEAVTELAQAMHEQNTGVDPNALDPQRLLRRMAVAGAVGGLAGAAFNLPEAAGRMAHQSHLESQAALSFADSAGTILQAMGESKANERAPERVRQLLEQSLEGTDSANVMFQGVDFDVAAQKAGIDPKALAKALGISNAREVAIGSGSEMAVPTAALLTEMAKLEKNGGDPQPLLLALRQKPGAPSVDEATALSKEQAQQLSDMREIVAKEAEKVAATDPIFEDVKAQAIAAGMSEKVATQQAKVYAAFFRVQADRWNAARAKGAAALEGAPVMDPLEEWKKYNLKIMRGLPSDEAVAKPQKADDRIRAILADIRKSPTSHAEVQKHLIDIGADVSTMTDAQIIDALNADMIAPEDEALADRRARTASLLKNDAMVLNQRIEPATAFLHYPNLLKQWKKANGDRSPTPGDKDWDHLVKQARMVDESRGMRYDQPKRGQIDIKRFIISMLEGGDKSTLLHEGGHLFLEVMGDFAERAGAPQEVVAQYESVLKWLGVDRRSEIKREQHEKFADGFEDYLREGKAPSEELKGAFRSFMSWLNSIYRLIRRTVTLNDDARAMFDRMLATEDELDAARGEPASQANSPEWMEGMTPKETAAYLDHVLKDNNEAEAAVLVKMMAPIDQEETKAWKERFDARRPEEAKLVADLPAYRAFDMLSKGSIKLSREKIVAEMGTEGPKRIKAVVAKAGEPGLTLAQAAELIGGFATGDELWTALANLKPREALIDERTNAYLRSQTPDPLTDGTAAEIAMKALHRQAHADVLNAQSIALAVRANRRAIPLARVRDMAKGIVANQKVSLVNPKVYLSAERRYGRLSWEKLRQKSYTESFLAKQQETLNHELFRAATEARDIIEKADQLFRDVLKPSWQQMMGKAGGYTWTVGGKVFDNEEDARAESTAKGLPEPTRDPGFREVATMLAEDARAKRKEMPYVNYAESYVMVDTLVYQAREASKLSKIAAGQQLQAIVEKLKATAAEHGHFSKPEAEASAWDRTKAAVKNVDAWLLNLATITRRMDGGLDNGPFWNLLMRPMNDAGNAESEMQYQASDRLDAAFTAWGKKDIHTKHAVGTSGINLSNIGRVMVALNFGTAANRERLMTGFSWSEEQVQQILDSLDEKDLGLVQAVWTEFERYFKDLNAQHERLFGVPMERQEPMPFTTKAGTLRGGYFPIVYNSASSPQAMENQLSSEAASATPRNPATNRSMTQKRSATTGMPLLLSESVITTGIFKAIHRITHEDALADIRKVLANKDVRSTIVDNYGPESYTMARDAIVDIAMGEEKARGTIEKAFRYLRGGMSIATMGYSATTAAVQLTGATQSMQRVGTAYFGRASAKIISDPLAEARRVAGLSDMMRQRPRVWHRDIMTANRDNGVLGQRKWHTPIARYAFVAIQKMQYMVDLVTWVAAHQKFQDENLVDPTDAVAVKKRDADAVAVADQTVLDTQGGGQTKDLAKIQRGNEYRKMFTAFYSYFNITYQRGSDAIHQGAGVKDIGRLSVDFLMLVSWPVVLGHLLMAGLKGDDDTDKSWSHLGKKLLKDHLSFMLNTVVGARELSGAAEGFTYSGPAGSQAFNALSNLYQQMGQVIDAAADPHAHVSETIDKGLWHAALGAAGILAHLPSNQVRRTIDGLLSLWDDPRPTVLPIIMGPPAHAR